MAFEDERRLAGEAVSRRFLSPAQANVALRALQEALAAGHPTTLRDVVLNQELLSPRRWEEFERSFQPKSPKSSGTRVIPPPRPTPAPPPGVVLPLTLGNYRLIQRLGEGGQAQVYRAIQLGLKRHVAVKLLPPALAADPDFVARFHREAHAAAALDHPNIVVPIDVGEDHGYHYLAMEFVEGENLAEWMARSGRLAWRDAVEITRQVAEGLDHAHRRGLVHRDIKPENILIDRATRLAKITDLGLAVHIHDLAGPESASATVGTPFYISPEQACGEPDIDGRSDIYSLGATLWHLVVGVPPFDGPTSAVVMTKHVTEPVPDPRTSVRDCPDDLAAILAQMMGKRPGDRYPDCRTLLADLDRLQHGQPLLHAPPFQKAERGPLRLDSTGERRAGSSARPRGPGATGRPGVGGSRAREASRARPPSTASRQRDPTASRRREGSKPGRPRGPAPRVWLLIASATVTAAAVAGVILWLLRRH